MSRTRSLGFAGLLLPFVVLVVIANAPVAAQIQVIQAAPIEVTTDTPEYCQQLLSRVTDLVHLASAPVPRDVVDLTSEGQRMCDHGQTRGGIMRLRSALLLMEKGNGPAYR